MSRDGLSFWLTAIGAAIAVLGFIGITRYDQLIKPFLSSVTPQATSEVPVIQHSPEKPALPKQPVEQHDRVTDEPKGKIEFPQTSDVAPSTVPNRNVSDAIPPSERPITNPISREMDDIVFAVNSCRFTGREVVCSLLFTNKGRDRDMRLGGQFGGTRIVDQSGREYVVDVIQLGARQCKGCAVVNKLSNDVPLSAGLSFANISSEISMISLLEINYSLDGGGSWNTVPLHGIPLSVGSR